MIDRGGTDSSRGRVLAPPPSGEIEDVDGGAGGGIVGVAPGDGGIDGGPGAGATGGTPAGGATAGVTA